MEGWCRNSALLGVLCYLGFQALDSFGYNLRLAGGPPSPVR